MVLLRRRRCARLAVAGVCVATVAVAAPATLARSAEATTAAVAPPSLPDLPSIDPGSPSLSAGGRALLETASVADGPRYAVSATVDPGTGDVDGRVRARVRADDGHVDFRVLAGLPALRAGLRVRDLTVDDKAVKVGIDQTLLRVPVKRSGRPVDVRARFSYRVPVAGSTKGRPLSQETIGVLSRTRDVTLLGHWFPLWLPPGAERDPGLSGFGDIGNFAAGAITARVQVPGGYEVVTGGVTVDRKDDAGGVTVTESGVGLRDLAVAVGRGLRSAAAPAGDVTVRASAAAGSDVEATARQSADDLLALSTLYAPYPWSEVDVVSVPLGDSVGGMEWPGTVWIADSASGGEGTLALAHELAHQWWHALVGNDSIRAPVVDEPLAQFSMCLVVQQRLGAGGGECAGLGGPVPGTSAPDTCADRPTDRFRSADQYGSLVYDQAPGFYFALSRAVGTDATLAALRDVIGRHAFGIVTPEQLRDELVAAFPERGTEVRDLWDRYIGPPGCGVGSKTPR